MTPITKDNKTLGFYDKEHKIFSKKVVLGKHLMKKYDAFAIDNEVFNKLFEKRAYIEITDDRGTIYSIRATEAVQGSFVDEYEGHGMQRFIPRGLFTKSQLV